MNERLTETGFIFDVTGKKLDISQTHEHAIN